MQRRFTVSSSGCYVRIPPHHEQRGPGCQRQPRTHGRNAMLTSRRASKFIRRFSGPGDDSGIVCFKFWQLVPAGGCPYQCSYCFLQTTPWFRFNPDQLHGLVYTNVDDMLREIDAWLQDPIPKMMIVGELQDGLVFETAFKKATGKPLTHWIVPKFAAQSRQSSHLPDQIDANTGSSETRCHAAGGILLVGERRGSRRPVGAWDPTAVGALRSRLGDEGRGLAGPFSARPDGTLPALAVRIQRSDPGDQPYWSRAGHAGCATCHIS